MTESRGEEVRRIWGSAEMIVHPFRAHQVNMFGGPLSRQGKASLHLRLLEQTKGRWGTRIKGVGWHLDRVWYSIVKKIKCEQMEGGDASG